MAKKEKSVDTLTVNLIGDIRLCVPNDASLMTPYILLEQEDWFEDEVKFVRKFIKPGMNVIDIGANFGTYSMNIAKKIGKTGNLWAFEPSSLCRSYLEKSITINGFKNIVLSPSGLSDQKRKAVLLAGENTELGHVSTIGTDNAQGESIDLKTLDECMEEYSWERIDFVKMDAEGEEANIIKGGRLFFDKFSPIVMYEYRHIEEINDTLISDFSALGFTSYRLVPGMNLLVPLDNETNNDAFMLNIFCCKEDRAVRLEKEGYLIRRPIDESEIVPVEGGWRKILVRFKYGKKLVSILGHSLAQKVSAAGWNEYRLALDFYAQSKNAKQDLALRYAFLKRAYIELGSITAESPNFANLQSYVRVAIELGERSQAKQVLAVLVRAIASGEVLTVPYPFISVSSRYEDIDPRNDLEGWIKASILETYEKIRSHSSYYTGISSLEFIEELAKSPFSSPEIERRRQLARMRAGLQKKPEKNDLVASRNNENRNENYWLQ